MRTNTSLWLVAFVGMYAGVPTIRSEELHNSPRAAAGSRFLRLATTDKHDIEERGNEFLAMGFKLSPRDSKRYKVDLDIASTTKALAVKDPEITAINRKNTIKKLMQFSKVKEPKELQEIPIKDWIMALQNPREIYNLLKEYKSKWKILDGIETEIGRNEKTTASIAHQIEQIMFEDWLDSHTKPEEAVSILDISANAKFLGPWAQYRQAFSARFSSEAPIKSDLDELISSDPEWSMPLLFAEAKESNIPSSIEIASKLETELIDRYVTSGKHVNEILTDLDFRKSLNPSLPWIQVGMSYLNAVVRARNTNAYDLFKDLEKSFPRTKLIEVLHVARMSPHEALHHGAYTLLEEIARPLYEKKGTPKEIFTQLELRELGNKMLSDPFFKRWLTYVDEYNLQHPNEAKSWILVLYEVCFARTFRFEGLRWFIDHGAATFDESKIKQELIKL